MVTPSLSAEKIKFLSEMGSDSPLLFADTSCLLGESPVWDERKDGLYWLDILARKLYFKAYVAGNTLCWNLPATCSVIFLIEEQESKLLLVSEIGLLIFCIETEVWNIVTTSGDEGDGWRSNDGGVDPLGRIWFGTMSFEPNVRPGAIYVWDAPKRPRKVFDGVHIPNTFVWSRSGNYLISADSFKHQILRYSYSLDSGEAIFDRILVDLSSTGFEPDGSAIDSEDHIWNAQWGGGRVVAYTLEGTEMKIINLPISRPTSCCFGGPDMSILFITSARIGLSDGAYELEKSAGHVFALNLDFAGRLPKKVQLLNF